jgi:hypothetical protein
MNAADKSKVPAAQASKVQTPARGNRMLSVVRGKDDRSLHLSPILQQIKDDGPAVIDGEAVVEKEAPKLAKPAAAAQVPVASVAPQPAAADKQIKILIGLCCTLAIGLGCSLYLSWQQQQRLDTVEYLLQALVANTR